MCNYALVLRIRSTPFKRWRTDNGLWPGQVSGACSALENAPESGPIGRREKVTYNRMIGPWDIDTAISR